MTKSIKLNDIIKNIDESLVTTTDLKILDQNIDSTIISTIDNLINNNKNITNFKNNLTNTNTKNNLSELTKKIAKLQIINILKNKSNCSQLNNNCNKSNCSPLNNNCNKSNEYLNNILLGINNKIEALNTVMSDEIEQKGGLLKDNKYYKYKYYKYKIKYLSSKNK